MFDLTTLETIAGAAILLDVACAVYLLYLTIVLSHNLGGQQVGRSRALAIVLSIGGAAAKACFGLTDLLDGLSRVLGPEAGLRYLAPDVYSSVAIRFAANHLSSAAILMGFVLVLRVAFRAHDTTIGRHRARLLAGLTLGRKG